MRRLVLIAAAGFAAAVGAAGARAATIVVEAGAVDARVAGGGRLASALAAAAAGDVLILQPGVYDGPVVIDKSLTLTGRPGAVVDGHGKGRVITVTAPDVTIRGLLVRRSGASLETMDAGIFLTETADNAVIENNRLEGNLFGIYVLGPRNALVRDNVVIGRRDIRRSERGDGIKLWRTPGSRVIGNDVSYGRDGIYTDTSRQNVFRGNRLRGVRFGIHYMYTLDSVVADNISIGNEIGYAIMFSSNLRITGNLSSGDREYGLMFNYTNRSLIANNIVRDGAQKCVFVYNANRNEIRHNLFEGCDIGIHFTAGSAHDVITDNSFIGNRTQVKYVGTRWLEWSANGRGNYWSDDTAFDLDGDGIADSPYRPNSIVDRIVWVHPAAKILLNSPAMKVLRWAQSRFPALYPGGVIDSKPLMKPPRVTVPRYHGVGG